MGNMSAHIESMLKYGNTDHQITSSLFLKVLIMRLKVRQFNQEGS